MDMDAKPKAEGASAVKTKHRLLIVAYHFPPDAEVGGRRPLSFARHLPKYGWEPAVLTVRPKHYERTDPDTLPWIPDHLQITRAQELPNLRDMTQAIWKWLKQRSSSRGTDSRASRTYVENGTTKVPAWRRQLAALSWTPDAMLGWYPPAVRAGKRLIDNWRPDAVMATGPPWTALLVGQRLARYASLPFIADFRDPWTAGEWKPDFVQTTWSRRWERYLEAKVIRSAATVTTVTEMLNSRFVTVYPEAKRKIRALYNGFEPPDGQLVDSPVEQSEPVLLRHLGTLYVGRDFGPLLEAIAELIRNGKATARDFRLENYGHIELPDSRHPKRMATSLGLSDCVSCHPPRPRGEITRLAGESDALIAISGSDFPYAIPYKTLEYLPLRRYILVIGPIGEAGRIVTESGSGVAFDPKDVRGIGESLLKFLAAKRSGKRIPGGTPDLITEYSSTTRASELSQILRRAMRTGQTKQRDPHQSRGL